MRLIDLEVKNIGTFLEGKIQFITENDNMEKPPVTIITGENGTGKTLLIDAIRLLLYGESKILQRDIIREKDLFNIKSYIWLENQKRNIFLQKNGTNIIKENQVHDLINPRFYNKASIFKNHFIIEYWASKLSTDSFEIKSLVAPNPNDLYKDALTGIHQNIQVTQLITFFDYLKSSEDEKEKALGQKLYETLKEIFKLSLLNGELKSVARTTLTPIISQNGSDIPLANLSSGNLYLVQRMVSLLGRMYCLHVLEDSPLEQLCKAKGVLLIDEAENHLHPKWQKTFIQSIQKIFPNLQIILTTHSPFIVSSVSNAKVFVCEAKGDHTIIVDETENYTNKPIEEILISPVFGATYSFNQEISELLAKRKNAKNAQERKKIEKTLLEKNPQYFSYLDMDNIISQIFED